MDQHFQEGDWVTARANDVHGVMSGKVLAVIPNEGSYTDWLYEVAVPGKRSFYWYESQLDISVIPAKEH